jgi:hypothetical protein
VAALLDPEPRLPGDENGEESQQKKGERLEDPRTSRDQPERVETRVQVVPDALRPQEPAAAPQHLTPQRRPEASTRLGLVERTQLLQQLIFPIAKELGVIPDRGRTLWRGRLGGSLGARSILCWLRLLGFVAHANLRATPEPLNGDQACRRLRRSLRRPTRAPGNPAARAARSSSIRRRRVLTLLCMRDFTVPSGMSSIAAISE